MAAVSDQAADLLKNLSLDSQSKTLEPTKKTGVDAVNTTNGQNQPLDRSITPQIPDYMDPTVAYFPNGYTYYGGYDGSTTDWDEYSRYVNTDGVDMSHGVYGDMYHGYGYAPYGPYSPATSPVPTVGHDGQMYGAQHYQYPSPYFQPMTPTAIPQKGENTASSNQPPLTIDTANRNSNSTVNGVVVKGPTATWPTTYQSPAYNANGYQDARYAFDGVHSPVPWLDSPMHSNGQVRNNSNIAPFSSGNGVTSRNQNLCPHTNVMSQRARGKLIQEVRESFTVDAFVGNVTDWEKFCVGNLVGMPVMVVPVGFKKIQDPPTNETRRKTTVTTGIYAPLDHDHIALALTMAYQSVTDHHKQRPPIDDLVTGDTIPNPPKAMIPPRILRGSNRMDHN